MNQNPESAMAAEDAAHPNTLCPSREELTAFSCGRLPLQRLETIADHLEICPSCTAALQAATIRDELVNQLGQPSSLLPHQEETACSRLEQQACAIAGQPSAEPTVSDKPADQRVRGPALPAAFGAYVLLEQIGQGGMGIVYKARQESLKRLVALKLVRAGIYASDQERARFQREGEAIARIHHPNVVQIHEFGEHEGQLYFSMELLPGGTLAQRMNGRPLPEREAAELVRTLAQTVGAAHREGVVHRDLKPSNVMFAADGTVKITDFGLAKMLDDEGSDTCTDAILGTPAYMAPEQASGTNHQIGPAADVYALGSILYETLTGRPPFRGQTRYQTLELVKAQQPKAPSRYRKGLSRALDQICLRCIQKEAAQRYASARELAEELERYLRGEPLQLDRETWPHRVWRGLTKNRAGQATLVVCAAGLLALGLFASLFWGRWRPQAMVPQEVVLIDHENAPDGLRWIVGELDSKVLAVPPNGVFTIHSKKIGLLQLLASPPGRSYRLEAEIQDEEGGPMSRGVGIFFALHHTQSARGLYCSGLELTFSEHGQSAGMVYFAAQHYQAFPPYHYLGSNARCSPFLFPAAIQQAPFPRRKLAIEVRDDEVHASWGENEWSQQISLEEIERIGKVSAFDDMKNQVNDWYTPQGSLGICIADGTALIHHVVLKPLQ